MKKVIFLFCCFILIGCHQQSNDSKGKTSHGTRDVVESKNVTKEKKDYSDWFLNYHYYYVASNTSTLMTCGISLNNDGTATLCRAGAELMAFNAGNPLKGQYTIEDYEDSNAVQTYVTSGDMTVNGEEPSRTELVPSVKITIDIPEQELQRVNGNVNFVKDETKVVLYGYTNDDGNKVLTTDEEVKSALQVYFHAKPEKANYVVSVDVLNLRLKPSLSADVVTKKQKGDILQVLDYVSGESVDNNSTWWEVNIDGQKCYAWSGALKTQLAYDAELESANDINLEEIKDENYESLAGTWRNGKGDTLVIQSNGSIVSTVDGRSGKESLGGAFRYESDGVPYIGVSNGHTGGLLALLKVGFKTTGDNSDTSKPRIAPTQNGVYHLSNDYYYYRQ